MQMKSTDYGCLGVRVFPNVLAAVIQLVYLHVVPFERDIFADGTAFLCTLTSDSETASASYYTPS